MSKRIKIGSCVVDPDRNLVIRDNQKNPIEQKVMDVLMFLVQHQGEVVSRELILEKVWEGTFVNEESLTRCISLLRKAFGDRPDRPAYIKTVKGKGYELIAQVAAAEQKKMPSTAKSLLNDFMASAWKPAVGLLILLFILVGFLPAIFSSSDNSLEFRYNRIKIPLTTQIGEELHPAVSSEGSRFAYTAFDESTESMNIYTQIVDTGEPLQLTRHPNDDFAPEWSPDGQQIAFVRSDESGGGSTIWLVPSLGGPEKRLISRNISGNPRIAWSPDGNRIAFTDRPEPDAPNAVFEVEVSTGDVTQLTHATSQHWGDHTPSYAPDGKSLTFIASVSAGTHAIFRLNRQTGTKEQLTPVPTRISGQTWGTDSSLLYYITDQPESRAIWVMDPDSPGSARWTGITGAYLSAGKDDQLLVQQTENNQNLFWTDTNNEAQNLQLYEFSSSGSDYSPVLSSHGNYLVFLSDRSGHTELWMYDYESSSLRQLTRFNGSHHVQSPAWAPDDSTISFTTFSPESHADIWTTDISGSPPKPLLGEPLSSNEVVSSWCPDGRSLVIGSNRTGKWQIWKYDVPTKSWKQITRNGGYAARCGPDDTIYFTKYDRPGIWKYDSQKEEEELLIESFGGLLPHTWHPDSEGIFYLNGQKPGKIGYFRFSDGQNFPEFFDAGETVEGLSYSPADQKLTISVTERRESGIYLYRRDE